MHHHVEVPGWYVAAATMVILWAVAMWTAVGVLAYANRGPVRPWVFRCSAAVIVLGVIGQIGHVQEHIAQAAYWIWHPEDKPWMTPLGTGLANALGKIDMSKPTLGMEVLHLTGNFIFLAGIAGVMLITRRATHSKARKWARMGVWMQGFHGLEHAALTISVALGSNAIGLSTWFGALEPGPAAWTYRVWWHFVANVVGSVIFGIALWHLWQERKAIKATYAPPERVATGTRAVLEPTL